jgi:hypothetical protein
VAGMGAGLTTRIPGNPRGQQTKIAWWRFVEAREVGQKLTLSEADLLPDRHGIERGHRARRGVKHKASVPGRIFHRAASQYFKLTERSSTPTINLVPNPGGGPLCLIEANPPPASAEQPTSCLTPIGGGVLLCFVEGFFSETGLPVQLILGHPASGIGHSRKLPRRRERRRTRDLSIGGGGCILVPLQR